MQRQLTLAEAAERLRLSQKTVKRRIAAGILSSTKTGGKLTVPSQSIERYLNANTTKGLF